ncbi:MAG: M23 family metallopeptidase [Candidatus Cohnella colombiensis]|uniref:M23 family metallopeptidase n=1 Tax=Candidatus Cohnella colombiensis TaxID=3121368 RepID=A0AA95JBW0_9BACL|nr:MAG: M23 family metallopeptidase [Cohnella sp.]
MQLRINGYPISAGFGDIDSVHKIPHTGVDIAMPQGTPLYAIDDGVITKLDVIGDQSTYGRMVRLDTDSGPDVVYGHLSQVNVKIGDHVQAGDMLGLSGNTGHSTGPHLHLQVISDGTNMDPTQIVPAATDPGFWQSVMDQINGFSDWFIGKEAELIAKPAGNIFMSTVKHLFELVSVHSAEIITLGVCACAVGMMVGPIIGSGSKWMGRMFIVFWGGVIWRMVT